MALPNARVNEKAELSFENAVFIDDERIAEKYFKEYCQALRLSEPIDWLQDEPKPDMEDKREHGVVVKRTGAHPHIK